MHMTPLAVGICCMPVLLCALCRHKYIAGFVAISAPWEGSVKALKGRHCLCSILTLHDSNSPPERLLHMTPVVSPSLHNHTAQPHLWSTSGGLKTADPDCRLHQRRQL